MKVAIGSDHAGYQLKEVLKKHLELKGYEVTDFGTNSGEVSVDYPDYAKLVSHSVVDKNDDFGLLVCGTGIGVSIAANKVKGIRAALVYDETTGALAKEHNDANVITLGARTTSKAKAIKIVDAYLNAHHEARHNKRIEKIRQLEEESK